MTKYFCAIPWVQYSLRPNGYVRVCCNANQGPTRGILQKEKGIPYTHRDKINDSRNCDLLKEIRRCILNNEWHPECIRCQRELKAGTESENLCVIKGYDHFSIEDAIKYTDENGAIDVDNVPILHYDLRFGNKCNIRCRTCFATDSDSWYQDLNKIYGLTSFVDVGTRINIVKENGRYIAEGNPYGWFEDEIFWENLKEHLHTIRTMYIVGGEPMLINQHFDFLKECIDSDNAKRIEVGYNTNLTIIPDRAIEIWKNFRSIYFGCSIDGIGNVNDYIRYPSRWNVIERNFKRLNKIKNFFCDIATTVSVFNMTRLVEIIEWGLDNIRDDKILINPHPLHGPSFYNIKMFPPSSKKKIKEKLLKDLEAMKNKNYSKNVIDQTENCINFYINFMNQDDLSNEIDYFWKITNKLDYYRNQKMKECIPELIELLPQERESNESNQL